MILVVGGTGTLGEAICQRLRARGLAVRALVRQTANPARLQALRGAGVDLCWGDLKDAGSLREACYDAEVVISTASSTFSRQDGDSTDTVDQQGQLSLIAGARAAGVEHFTFVTIPRNPVRESPLTRAKAEAERALADSGMRYTILACNYFMEIWRCRRLPRSEAELRHIPLHVQRIPSKLAMSASSISERASPTLFRGDVHALCAGGARGRADTRGMTLLVKARVDSERMTRELC